MAECRWTVEEYLLSIEKNGKTKRISDYSGHNEAG